jgi:GntR family histidine utilization transcriptional repressor
MAHKNTNINSAGIRPIGTKPTIQSLSDQQEQKLTGKGHIPLYQQVKEYILGQIRSGNWAVGSKVPSENKLIKALGVSKMTINRPLRELTMEGVLQRIQGVGTFVAAPTPTATLLEIKPIAEEISQKGGEHSCRVHSVGCEKASPDLALAMALPPGAEVFHVLIVHSADGIPVQLEDRYVNPTLAPDFLKQDFKTVTPSRYLLNEIPVSEVEHVVEALLPDEKTSELLQVGSHEPCIVLYRRTWSENQVVTRCRFIHPGSRYRFGGRFQPAPSQETTEA